MRYGLKTLTLAAALIAVSCTLLHAQPVRTQLGKGYVTTYDSAAARLECISENQQYAWRASVSGTVPTQADWSGVATSAGPVFVYTSGNAVSYVLMRFQDGSTSAEKGGKSLRGPVAPGRLVSASWKPAQYGAKVTVVSLDGSKEYTTDMDINMWGTSKKLSQKSRAIQAKRDEVPGSGVSIETPPGFTAKWDADSKCLALVPQTGLPVGMLINMAEGVHDLTEFADAFMKDIGPALGSTDMKQVGSKNVTVGGSMPGQLRLANGSRNDKEATFAFVFFTTSRSTVVMVYLSPSQSYDQYANLFYRLIAGVKVK